MPRTIALSILFLALTILTFGCDTLTGPQGPEGPRGPAGPKGAPGVANIQEVTFTIDANEVDVDGSEEYLERSMSAITDAIQQNGLVLAYIDLGSDSWWALPMAIPTPHETVSVSYAHNTGQFLLSLVTQSDETVARQFDGYRVRVVLIPPSEADSVAASVDLTSYTDLSRFAGSTSR